MFCICPFSRLRRLSSSSLRYSLAQRNLPRIRSQAREAAASGRALAWASRPPGKQLKGPTLTRSAHSLELFPSEAGLLLEHAIVQRWTEPSLFAGTTSTSLRNIRGTRRGTPTFLLTSPRASVSRKVTMSSSASAGPSPKLWGSTWWKSSQLDPLVAVAGRRPSPQPEL